MIAGRARLPASRFRTTPAAPPTIRSALSRGEQSTHAVRWIATIASVVLLSGCGGFIEPTTCERNSTACAGIHDARFCDYVALAVAGSACSELGIGEAKHFCVVTSTRCIDTNYSFSDRDCRIVRYEAVRDSARADCSSDTPTFVMR